MSVPWSPSINLKPGYLEIIVKVYDAGEMKPLYQRLVPEPELERTHWVPLLRALICRFGDLGFEAIVEEHLRPKGPLVAEVECHEAGVERTWVGGAIVVAWIDCVVRPEIFRQC